MIIGLGIDVQAENRIRKLEKRYGELLITEIFTKKEWNQAHGSIFSNPYKILTNKFSFKESVSKALGTGISGFKFADIEIIGNASNPRIKFYNRASEIYKEKQVDYESTSSTYCDGIVFTQVIFWRK
ncbi:4'-phosphopantetheinyl transferase superfamily protein [Lactiplantibacillus plantarum]